MFDSKIFSTLIENANIDLMLIFKGGSHIKYVKENKSTHLMRTTT